MLHLALEERPDVAGTWSVSVGMWSGRASVGWPTTSTSPLPCSSGQHAPERTLHSQTVAAYVHPRKRALRLCPPLRTATHTWGMALAVTRTQGQAIIMTVDGREIRVEVARIERGEVRLAITAPDDIAIWREELTDRSSK